MPSSLVDEIADYEYESDHSYDRLSVLLALLTYMVVNVRNYLYVLTTLLNVSSTIGHHIVID